MVQWFNNPTAQCADTFAQAYVVCKLCLYVAYKTVGLSNCRTIEIRSSTYAV